MNDQKQLSIALLFALFLANTREIAFYKKI